MPIRSQEDHEIVQARLLYTALIKAALIAWGRGYAVANPHKDATTLSANKQVIVDSLVAYFKAVPNDVRNGLVGTYGATAKKLDDADQIVPVLEAISSLHAAVKHSGQKYATQIAGATEIETLRNLIAFFKDCPE